jgi:hypothetical protein
MKENHLVKVIEAPGLTGFILRLKRCKRFNVHLPTPPSNASWLARPVWVNELLYHLIRVPVKGILWKGLFRKADHSFSRNPA